MDYVMPSAVDELLGKRHGLVDGRRVLKMKLTALLRDITALDRVLLMLDPSYKPPAGQINRRKTRRRKAPSIVVKPP